MCTGIDIYCLFRLHPEDEAHYELWSTLRWAHGFVATRRNSSLFLARCALPCTQRIALHSPSN